MEDAAGKVITGFSLPYVAKYVNGGGGTVSYTGGMKLARGVSVDLDVSTYDDNEFYADNVVAESAPRRFSGGTLNLTVDGLIRTAENLVMGLPEPTSVSVGSKTVKMYDYGDDMGIPYVGVGYVVRYMSGGVESFVPTIITKVRFDPIPQTANTQEEEIDWQTTDISAAMHRDDTAAHNWKRVGEDLATEAEAEAVIKAVLNITGGSGS